MGPALDVADSPALQAFVDDAAELGGLDVFVANASEAMGRGLDDEAWQRGERGHPRHGPGAARRRCPPSSAPESALLVVVGSIAGCQVTRRRAYSSIKAALYPYVKTFARDVGPRGVQANLVSPGQIFFEGGIWDRTRVEDPERCGRAGRQPDRTARHPGGGGRGRRVPRQPRASFVSGTNLVVDGARMYRMPV